MNAPNKLRFESGEIIIRKLSSVFLATTPPLEQRNLELGGRLQFIDNPSQRKIENSTALRERVWKL